MKKIAIMDVEINNINKDETIEIISKWLLENKTNVFTIFTPNTEIIMLCDKDDNLKRIINDGSLVLPDGIGLIIASKIKNKPLKQRITGFDTSIEILKIAKENNYKIYLLGGAPGVSGKAAKKITEEYGNIICGNHHGYFKGNHTGYKNDIEELEIINNINSLKPDILFVGFGSPKQEMWIDLNKHNLHTKLIIGNGGSMDVISGNVKRAPMFFQKFGLEWLYRLIKDPKRIKRQTVLPIFIFKILFSSNKIVREINKIWKIWRNM